MTSILSNGAGGPGESASIPDEAAGGLGVVLDSRADELALMGAAEAIDALAAELGGGAGALDMAPIFPGPIAEAAYWDDGSVVGIQGPVGSGKTTTVLKSRTRRAMTVPRSVIDGRRRYKLLVIRATYRQLWSTTIPDFLGVFPKDLGEWAGGRGGPVTFEMRFEDGSHVPPPEGHDGDWSDEILMTVEFMAFGDDIQGSMRGYQATDIWLHEMDTNPIDVILNGITRINRYPAKVHLAGYPPELQDFGQIVGDFNAPEPDNWIIGLFHDEAKRADTVKAMNADLPAGARPITISFHRQPGYSEPGAENLHNLGPGYYPTQIATMRLLGRGDQIERLVYNRVVHARAGEPVFQREFRRRLHVADAPLTPWAGVPMRIGLDQGFKGAAVIGQVLVEGTAPRRRVFWQILGELHFPAERLMARVFGQRLSELLAIRWPGLRVEAGWGDMAGEHGASQAADENETWNLLVGRAVGIRVRPQKIGTNRIQPRLEAVRAALEAPIDAGRTGLLIDPSCKHLIAAFEARYVWTDEVNAQGDKRKVPDKSLTEANVMDACQYLLLSEHKPDGTSPMSFPDLMGQTGLNRSLPLRGEDPGGLQRGFDILNPYRGLNA